MLRKRWKLLAGIILLALLAVFFRYAGILIVAEDSPEKADLIIVLMGSGPDCYCYFIMSGDRRCNLAKS